MADDGPPVASGAAAHERLRRAVVRLELAPGAAVSEQQLAERFNLSKAAVRAALARLRAEGLVVAEPRRGHVVAQITLRDVAEVYELRALVEPAAAAAAAPHVDSAALDALLERIRVPVDPADPASIDRFLVANRAIHVTVAEASGNRRLAAFVGGLLDESERAIGVGLRAGGALQERGEHAALLEALARRDAAAAERLMRATIDGFRIRLLEVLGASAAVQDAALSFVQDEGPGAA